jgi:hypothetical protein
MAMTEDLNATLGDEDPWPNAEDLAAQAEQMALWSPGFEWIRWISGTDAQLLLMFLCHCIMEHEPTLENLQWKVETWRTAALKALADPRWRAQVDEFLEVWADARLAWLSRRDH